MSVSASELMAKGLGFGLSVNSNSCGGSVFLFVLETNFRNVEENVLSKISFCLVWFFGWFFPPFK